MHNSETANNFVISYVGSRFDRRKECYDASETFFFSIRHIFSIKPRKFILVLKLHFSRKYDLLPIKIPNKISFSIRTKKQDLLGIKIRK